MGAYGGKLCGAGGGGFFLFILPQNRKKKLKNFWRKELHRF